MGQPSAKQPQSVAPLLVVGDRAPDVTLKDATAHVGESLRDSPSRLGETRPREVSLHELWEAAPLVLLFVRHFG